MATNHVRALPWTSSVSTKTEHNIASHDCARPKARRSVVPLCQGGCSEDVRLGRADWRPPVPAFFGGGGKMGQGVRSRMCVRMCVLHACIHCIAGFLSLSRARMMWAAQGGCVCKRVGCSCASASSSPPPSARASLPMECSVPIFCPFLSWAMRACQPAPVEPGFFLHLLPLYTATVHARTRAKV